jgi:hypothetical protein
MQTQRYQQGDKVSYTGEKFAKDLHGKLGVVCGRVGNTEHGVVVDFGDESYVMDEARHLTPFQGKLKSETPEHHGEEKKKVGAVEVSKRRGKRSADTDAE